MSTAKALALTAYMAAHRDTADDSPHRLGELRLDAATYEELAKRGFTRPEVAQAVNRLARHLAVETHHRDGTPVIWLVNSEEDVTRALFAEDDAALYRQEGCA
jgi:hypothetical protein